ncbi:hypothetical protein [Kitasatospora sp. NPDC096140]|uniref:hypothetical protein n=1 Tax=Kitasatospora sp. NPDC096140 TaxID=3155425 RepID=UPI0033338BCA
MTPSDSRPLPEELLLLCAHPDHGRFRAPVSEFHHAVALIGVSGLEHRLYPGRPGAPIRRAVRKPARDLPIPQAVRRVGSSD